ncbi:DUF5799 family protein [Halapricum salinum]|uniref:Uncharacterized protein n=1 Tax=Halapricum salinum TaxID=1457250 RepID=A0A4D6HGR6_9EURY|nr:DUF5799 family protein [Halapricum salinum]QCC52785.1 hypothetical protein DV733_16780 [Halapricum salinum]
MSDSDWTDMLAAERMRVDRKFEDQLEASSFSRQQWGLVMTAADFEIDGPENPKEATLRADTSKLSSVMSEIKNLDKRGGGMASPSGGGRAGGSGSGGGGILGKIAGLFGGGGGGGGALQHEAEELAAEYTEKLQSHLEKRGRWETICEQAAGE